MVFSAAFYVISLSLALIYPTTAHLVQRQAAGSDFATSSSAIPTTILTAPTEETATGAPLLTATATASPTSTAASLPTSSTTSVEECHVSGGQDAPFCNPTSGTSITVDDSFHVTWDTSYFTSNATVAIEIVHSNSSTTNESPIFTTDQVENTVGYVLVDPKESWLAGQSSMNVTFKFTVLEGGNANNQPTTMTGPVVTFTDSSNDAESSGSPMSSPTDSSSSKSTKNLGLVVGLTIALAFITLVCVSGVFVWYRRYKARNQGYGVRQSRSQRVGSPLGSSMHGSMGGQGTVRLGGMQSANAPLPAPPRPPRPVTKDMSSVTPKF